MKKVLIFGGTGFIGNFLERKLTQSGYEVYIVTRSPSRQNEIGWDGKNLGAWQTDLDSSDVVINLSGKSINCLHTPENQEKIRTSRIDSVKVINKAIAMSPSPPGVFIQAGSLAQFANTGQVADDESTVFGKSFTADVSREWEEEFFKGELPKTRKVNLRIGLVFGHDGGAFPSLAAPAKYFLGGPVGDGNQMISWIHQNDFARMVIEAIDNHDIRCAINAVAPAPVSNRALMKAIRKALGKPWSPPAPAFAVKLVARYILKTEPSLIFDSIAAIPSTMQAVGFQFEFPDIETAAKDLLRD